MSCLIARTALTKKLAGGFGAAAADETERRQSADKSKSKHSAFASAQMTAFIN